MRWLAVCLLGIAACAPSLSGAEGDFKAGRLPAAKEKLVGLEPASATWSAPRRAEYALYRGLVHHGLGDRSAALVWLRQANEHAALLSEDDRTRLKLALDAIGPSE